jgi:hypothetical protein
MGRGRSALPIGLTHAWRRSESALGAIRPPSSVATSDICHRRAAPPRRAASPPMVPPCWVPATGAPRLLGWRDHTVILPLLRPSLRGRGAALSLEDLDWRAAELVVHGKGPRVGRLSVPADVGVAIVAYRQRGRPTTRGRERFLRASAPLAVAGVRTAAGRACRRGHANPPTRPAVDRLRAPLLHSARGPHRLEAQDATLSRWRSGVRIPLGAHPRFFEERRVPAESR